MTFKMVHENYNVYDLQKSLDFYKEALGLTEVRRKEARDGSFIIVYIGNKEKPGTDPQNQICIRLLIETVSLRYFFFIGCQQIDKERYDRVEIILFPDSYQY